MPPRLSFVVVLGAAALAARSACLYFLAPQDCGLLADYALGAAWAWALGAGLLVWPVTEPERRALGRIWALKVVVTFVPMLFYEARYEIDPYFVQARLGDRSEAATRLMGALLWLTPGSFNGVKATLSMLGLLGVFLAYRAAVAARRREDLGLLYGAALFPSVLFWSSVAGKDAACLFGLGLCAYGAARWSRAADGAGAAAAAGGLMWAAWLRPWLGPIAAVPLAAVVAASKLSRPVKAAAIAAAGALTGALLYARAPGIDELRELHAASIWLFPKGGSRLPVPPLDSAWDFLRHLPFGMFRALVRPLPGEMAGLWPAAAQIENFALLLLLCLAAARARLGDLREPLVRAALLFILAWAAVYGLAVFNQGAMSRYRVQVLPLLLLLILSGLRRRP